MRLEELLADPAAHIREVDRALTCLYGTPELQCDDDPLGGLIETILSQHTSDTNSARAYASLRERFLEWEQVRTARVSDIAAAIRSGGLADMKAGRIQAALDTIVQRYGSLSLDALREQPLAEARAALRSLPGVGPKTASCVLLFSLGKPAFPVDTHVHRVSRRIGFAAPKASPEAVQDLVEAGIEAGRAYPLHVNLIAHGRLICKAERPRCDDCDLRILCRYGMLQAWAR
jgi:endonuclease-3